MRLHIPLGKFLPLLIVVLSPAMVSAQAAKPLGTTDLKKSMDALFTKRSELIRGERAPSGKEDQDLMDVTAKWYIYRITWPGLIGDGKTTYESVTNSFESEFIGALQTESYKVKNREYVNQLGKHMHARFKEVFELDFADNRSAVINGAMLLPIAAKLKQEEVADLLVRLIEDRARHDAVKLYAIRALREFMPARIFNEVNNQKDEKQIKRRDTDLARVSALIYYLNRKWPTPASDYERDAIRFLRREALMTLAQAGVPAISAMKKDNEVKGAVAYELLRFLSKGKDAPDPAPGLGEKIEAVIGVTNLKLPGDVGYDPSAGVYLVGQALVEFTNEYNKDRSNITSKKMPPLLLWKVQAERLKISMKDLAENTKGTPANANALRLEKFMAAFSPTIQRAETLELTEFRNAVAAMKPKTGGVLYKNVTKSPEIDLTETAPVEADN